MIEVKPQQDRGGVIELKFDGQGEVPRELLSLYEAAARLFRGTVLSGLDTQGIFVSHNYSGVKIDFEALGDRSNYDECKTMFAESVQHGLICGTTKVHKSFVSNTFTINFGEFVANGSGEAAAILVAETVKQRGIHAFIDGSDVSFHCKPLQKEALSRFIAAVNSFDRERRQILS